MPCVAAPRVDRPTNHPASSEGERLHVTGVSRIAECGEVDHVWMRRVEVVSEKVTAAVASRGRTGDPATVDSDSSAGRAAEGTEVDHVWVRRLEVVRKR